MGFVDIHAKLGVGTQMDASGDAEIAAHESFTALDGQPPKQEEQENVPSDEGSHAQRALAGFRQARHERGVLRQPDVRHVDVAAAHLGASQRGVGAARPGIAGLHHAPLDRDVVEIRRRFQTGGDSPIDHLGRDGRYIARGEQDVRGRRLKSQRPIDAGQGVGDGGALVRKISCKFFRRRNSLIPATTCNAVCGS